MFIEKLKLIRNQIEQFKNSNVIYENKEVKKFLKRWLNNNIKPEVYIYEILNSLNLGHVQKIFINDLTVYNNGINGDYAYSFECICNDDEHTIVRFMREMEVIGDDKQIDVISNGNISIYHYHDDTNKIISSNFSLVSENIRRLAKIYCLHPAAIHISKYINEKKR